MSTVLRLIALVVFLPLLALTGCGRSSSTSGASSAATPNAATTSPAVRIVPSMPNQSVVTPADHAKTKRYKIDISYPDLPSSYAVLVKTLHAVGDKAKREFIQGLPNPKQFPGLANRQFLLKLDFSVASRTARFVSVREQGMASTGGAHPLPIDDSFVYDIQAKKIISLNDLFSSPDKARKKLATLARKRLETKLLAKVPGGTEAPPKVRKEWKNDMRKMIESGTTPTREHFPSLSCWPMPDSRASVCNSFFHPTKLRRMCTVRKPSMCLRANS